MPDYFQDGNNLLGSRPRPRTSDGRMANPLVVTVLCLAVLGAAAALLLVRPVSIRGQLGAAVVYILAEFPDGHTEAGSGWVGSGDGKVITTRQIALPQGSRDAPTRYRVYVNSGQPNQHEYVATLAGQGADNKKKATGSSGDQRFEDWALLQIKGLDKRLPYLVPGSTATDGQAIRICGFDPSSQSITLVTRDDTIRSRASAERGVAAFSFAALPDGMQGGPVLDRASGAVIGMFVENEEGTGWAIPIAAIPPLVAAAPAGQ